MIRKKSSKSILIAIMILIGCMAVGSINAYAVEVVGENTGLRVKLSDIPVDTDNLNPGDTKTSTMTIYIDPNSTTSSLRVWIRSEIVENILGKEVNGNRGNLDDRLVLSVTHENGKVIHNGAISKFDKNVEVGYIQKGDPVDLTFTVHLPGETTGNEYQGASMKVKWIITAQYEPSVTPTPTNPPLSPPTEPPTRRVTTIPTPTPTLTPTTTPTQPPAEPTRPAEPTKQVTPSPTPVIVEIEDEDTPVGPGEPDKSVKPGNDETELIIIKEEEIPKGLPKTGEMPPILFYGLGAGAIFAGIKLNQKSRKN